MILHQFGDEDVVEGRVRKDDAAVLLPEVLHLGGRVAEELLGALRGNTVEHHADGDAVGIKCGYIGGVLLVLDIDLADDVRLLKAREQLTHKANRQLVLLRQFVCREGYLILLKTAYDDGQEVEHDVVLVAAGHVLQVALVGKHLVVLDSETQFRAHDKEQATDM